jgi:hypothetical protein
MTPDIIRKLAAELDKGITTEVQVVYLLAGIRKIIERDNSARSYPDLKFHCDWALHASLDRSAARNILTQFDAAHVHLRGNVRLQDLPHSLGREIKRISEMESFEESLEQFLNDHQLPRLTLHRADGWTHFLHLYAQVIEDIPLVVSAPPARQGATQAANHPQHISRVTVHCEMARETIKHDDGEEMLFKVRWVIHDRNGQSGEIFIINSFSVEPQG